MRKHIKFKKISRHCVIVKIKPQRSENAKKFINVHII